MSWFELEAHKDRGIWSETQFFKVFPFQMQSNCFLKVPGEFIEGFSLSDHWKIDAFAYVIPVPFRDMNLDDLFHTRSLNFMYFIIFCLNVPCRFLPLLTCRQR